MKGFDEETLRKWTLPAPVDEFGVKPENMFYNKEEDRFFCLLDAPNKEAIEKHHARFGMDYRSSNDSIGYMPDRRLPKTIR